MFDFSNVKNLGNATLPTAQLTQGIALQSFLTSLTISARVFYCRNNWICLFANHIDSFLVSQFSLRYLKKVDQIYSQPHCSNFQANFSINWSARHFFD